jgi:cyclopropane fatty-acyl-phospholipid synthase-like methyltransferase
VDEPKRIVEDGYDEISERYTELSRKFDWEPRRTYLNRLVELLPEGSRVLELGCGAGVPATVELARHFDVTGVDLSSEQLSRARENVPNARFIHADMATVELADSFDGVAAFYSLTHLPRDEVPSLFLRIRAWLRPGGILVASLAARETEKWFEPDWLGTPMFFSGYDAETNLRLLADAGFEIQETELVRQDEGELGEATFCWVAAKAGTRAI